MVLTVSKYRFQHWLFTLLTAHNVSLKILRAKRYSFEAFSLGTLNRYIQSSSKHQVIHFGMVHLAPAAECIHKVLPLNSKSGCVHIFLFTLLIYTCYHLSRKPLSIVKSVLHQNCSEEAHKKGKIIVPENETFCDWAPFDNQNYDSLFGTLDLIFLSLYAISMFFSGHVADKMDLRIYLCIGTLLSGMTTIAFGLGYFFNIHSFTYYAIVQGLAGLVQASGWPAVVACMGNWFGKDKRGFFMGVWTAHASIGNILGSLIAGAFVEKSWGWSFIVPGLIIGFFSLPIYFFLVPYPESVGVRPPVQYNLNDGPIDQAISDGNSFEESLGTTTSQSNLLIPIETKSSSFLSALKVPGVVEYSLTLFFSKLVSYTFIFWLPMYIREAGGFNPSSSADLSAVFDLGGILGGIIAGYVSDSTGSSAITCVVMLALSIPTLYLYSIVGFRSLAYCIGKWSRCKNSFYLHHYLCIFSTSTLVKTIFTIYSVHCMFFLIWCLATRPGVFLEFEYIVQLPLFIVPVNNKNLSL
ncbi:Glucose-6-phosphate exchanger SLC37A2 isoform 2 [Schistosoma japonicum]|uniref:Glucose-6-phosphate exchanger SLC37A2 isoform 2 n=1 Tax=Schistosoma japonicum TaxID=6182 RepID=A0A4Z2CLQ1_SCHJA|nr:Glucose-6-phosphate exchanger SLC37A2 isoform 2 [Schistosoma japonicum]